MKNDGQFLYYKEKMSHQFQIFKQKNIPNLHESIQTKAKQNKSNYISENLFGKLFTRHKKGKCSSIFKYIELD